MRQRRGTRNTAGLTPCVADGVALPAASLQVPSAGPVEVISIDAGMAIAIVGHKPGTKGLCFVSYYSAPASKREEWAVRAPG